MITFIHLTRHYKFKSLFYHHLVPDMLNTIPMHFRYQLSFSLAQFLSTQSENGPRYWSVDAVIFISIHLFAINFIKLYGL